MPVVSVLSFPLSVAVTVGSTAREVIFTGSGMVVADETAEKTCDLGYLVVVIVTTDNAVRVVAPVDQVWVTRSDLVPISSTIQPTSASLSSCMLGSDVPFEIIAR